VSREQRIITIFSHLTETHVMLTRVKKTHPALKHGGYSATSILPGEDLAAFEKLRRELIAELSPKGVLEHDIVATIARLVWRKRNLATFRLAELARKHYDAIRYEHIATVDKKYNADPQLEIADREARKDLAEAYELTEIGEPATFDRLLQELGVEERLDAMIDRCLKRLLFLRGLKSLPRASSSAPLQPIAEPQRIPGPTRAA
jgi:hypothetical protein